MKTKTEVFNFLGLYQEALSEDIVLSKRAQEKLRKLLKRTEFLAEQGIPGWQIRWLLKNLEKANGLVSNDFEKKNWPEILQNYLQGPASDLYFGLSGAIYGINPHTDALNGLSKKILLRLKNELVTKDGIRGWLGEQGRIDLGLPHGITGVALALSLLQKRVGVQSDIKWLLDQLEMSFQFILKCESIEELQVWPRFTTGSSQKRIGWCRSDLSTGVSLIVVAHRTGREKFDRLGRQFLQRSKQAAAKEFHTDNPYLCHGSSGNFYLLNLAFELIGDSWFLQRARDVDRTNEKYLASRKFPQSPHPLPYHLLDLRNCRLPALTFHEGLDSSWDFILAFRDPFDQRIL